MKSFFFYKLPNEDVNMSLDIDTFYFTGISGKAAARWYLYKHILLEMRKWNV